jgi:hypothetical protein
MKQISLKQYQDLMIEKGHTPPTAEDMERWEEDYKKMGLETSEALENLKKQQVEFEDFLREIQKS